MNTPRHRNVSPLNNILRSLIYRSVRDRTHQEGLIELEGARELPLQLMNAVQPLQEDRATLVQVLRVFSVAASVGELVAKVQPLRLHQNLEALKRRRRKIVKNRSSKRNYNALTQASFALRSNPLCFTNPILKLSCPHRCLQEIKSDLLCP